MFMGAEPRGPDYASGSGSGDESGARPVTPVAVTVGPWYCEADGDGDGDDGAARRSGFRFERAGVDDARDLRSVQLRRGIRPWLCQPIRNSQVRARERKPGLDLAPVVIPSFQPSKESPEEQGSQPSTYRTPWWFVFSNT